MRDGEPWRRVVGCWDVRGRCRGTVIVRVDRGRIQIEAPDRYSMSQQEALELARVTFDAIGQAAPRS